MPGMRSSLALLTAAACSAASAPPTIWPQPLIAISHNETVTVLGQEPDISFFTASVITPFLQSAFQRYVPLTFPHQTTPAAPGTQGLRGLMVYVEDVSQERPDLDTDEGYTIDVPTSGIGAVSAKTVFGALRALETFSQLVRFDFDSGRYVIDGAPWRIEDRPRFPHRGLMVDTSRHFQSLASLRAIIDTLPYAKINVLHWHIVDAQSFPFESKSSPKLWQGSYSPSERYTQVDAASIVEYARLRGVRVVPEFDMPGHADSWCVGYPHICPSTTCRTPLNVASNATFDLIEALLSEVTGNKPGAGLFPDSFLHLGGDEVNTDCWTKTPAVAAWLKAHNMTADQGYAHFTKRVATMALEQGRRPVQWNEVYDHFKTALPKKTVVHVWTSVTNVTEVAANGYNMLRNMGYFNYSWYLDNLNVDWRGVYQNEPCESIPTEELCKKVLGGHGEMWGETVDASDLQQTVWPRMASIAEKLWSSREHTQDVAAALPRIQNFRCLLLERGVAAAPVENAMARSAPAGPGSCYPRPGAAEVRGFQQLMI